MQNLRRRVLIGLAFGFLVIAILLLLGDLRRIGESLATFRWELLPLILGATLVNYGLRFIKWHFYLSRIGIDGLPPLASARIFVAGFPLAVTPGKAGEAVKALWLKRATGVPVSRAVPVVLAERVSDGLAMVVLSSLGVLAFPRYWPAFAAALALLLGLIVISQIRPLSLWLLDLVERLPVVGRLSGPLRGFYEGAFLLFRPKVNLIAVSLGTVAWASEGLGAYLVLVGLGVDPGPRTLALAVFVLSLSIIVGALSALPGGLGATEASMATMLTVVLGLPAATAASATLLVRFATLWFGVSLGFGVWALSAGTLFGPSESDPTPIEVPEGGAPTTIESG